MAFSFEKFVQKSTRGLFAFIVIAMVVPLVLWGYMGRSGNEKEEDKSDAGTLYGRIHISKAEYNRHLAIAPASWWWKQMDYTMMMMQYGQRPKDPTPDDLAKQAWEDIVLLREARAEGLTVNETDTLMGMREIYLKIVRRGDFEHFEEIMAQISDKLLHIPYSSLQTWVADHVLIEKLLTLVTDSEFADYDKVYDRLMKGQPQAKVWYTSFDPKDYLKNLKMPTTDEITAYYQKNKDRFKVPAKVQVAYLMASSDELKKKQPEPGEADVKAYYNDHKAEFVKPHEHAPGHAHTEEEKPEYRPFEEAKAEIPDRIKQKAADLEASELMSQVDVALGAAATANNNKYPDDVFDQLAAKFKAQGTPILHDITVPFDARQVEDVEKTVGTASTLGSWAFDPAQKVGDISQKVKTSKGVALFRIQKKIDATDSAITERVRESIVKELQKEQIKKKTQQAATNLVQEITTHGMIAARRRAPRDWRLTRYFTLGGGETPFDDRALGQTVVQDIQSMQLLPGKATVISGASLGERDKADWAYVAYLEDLVDVPPADSAGQFAGTRRGLDDEARRKYRAIYTEQTVKDADVRPDASLKRPENPPNSAPNP